MRNEVGSKSNVKSTLSLRSLAFLQRLEIVKLPTTRACCSKTERILLNDSARDEIIIFSNVRHGCFSSKFADRKEIDSIDSFLETTVRFSLVSVDFRMLSGENNDVLEHTLKSDQVISKERLE